MDNKILNVVFLIIMGWFFGYMHHYTATKDILLDRQETAVLRQVAEQDMRRYAGLVMYQEDLILSQASEMADEILLAGDKSLEFHQLCKEIRRAKKIKDGG